MISLSPVRAQTGSEAQGNAGTTAPKRAPAGQAPEEVMKKLSDLVHAGKYAEAQQLTTGLLMAYPNDQRLIKVKALLDKAPASPSSAKPGPKKNQPLDNGASAPVAANSNDETLSGMDKVDYSALLELVRQAQQTTDLPEQTRLLQQFMVQSGLFLEKHPEQMMLWQFRVVSAISLNKPLAGYEAAQRLLEAGAADSADPNLQRLLAQLKNKGWLDKKEVDKLYEEQRYVLVDLQGEAADKPATSALRAQIVQNMTALLQSQYPTRQLLFTSPALGDSAPVLTLTVNVHDTTLSPCTYSMRKNVWKCPAQSLLTVTGNSPQGWSFNKTDILAGGTDGIGWGTPRTPLTGEQVRVWIGRRVGGVFREILGFEEVRAALGNSIPKPAGPDTQSSAPVGTPAPIPAVPAAQSFAPLTHSPAPTVQAPAPEPASGQAVHSVAFMSTSAPEHEAEVERATAPMDNATPTGGAQKTAILHVYRPHHLYAATQKPYVYIDGKKITPIANSQVIRMLLTPGKHNISASKKYVENEIPVNDLDMAAGGEYWIRVDISAGAWEAHSKLYVVPSEQAQSESKRMEELRIGDVSMNQR